MKITMNLLGNKEVIAALNRLRIVATEKVREVVNEAAINVQREAKGRCPVDTGRLRSSIRATFYADGLAAEVGTDVEYAPHVEFGTRPHFPPPGALAGWGRRHKISEFPVARAISQRGTAAHPFLFPAWEMERPKFVERIVRAIKGSTK